MRELASLEARVERNESAAANSIQLIQARGVAQLFAGRVADAVADIEIAVTRDARRGDWWSDLAAAYLVRGGAANAPEDLVRGLDASRRAVETSPDLPEAHYNFALALEANELIELAALAWRRYLELDPASPWADEARARQQLLRARHDAARAPGGGEPCSLVAGWLWRQSASRLVELLRRGDPAAAPALAAIERRVSPCRGDRALLSAIVREASECRAAGTCESLAIGFDALGTGSRCEREHKPDCASAAFEEAERRFASAGNPAVFVATFGAATATLRGGEPDRARPRLIDLALLAGERGYHGVAGEAWLQAVNATNGFERLDTVLDLSQRAFTAYAAAGDPALLATGHNLLSTFLGTVGARQRAWEHRLASIRLQGDTSVDAGRRMSTLMGGAQMATREQLHGAAVAFLEAAVLAVDAEAPHGDRAEVRIALAQALEQAGSRTRAREVVAEALTHLATDVPPRLRAALDARVAAVDAALALPDAPERAIERLTAAVQYHESVQNTRRLPELLLMRARAYLTAGDATQARADLHRAASLVEGGAHAAGVESGAYFENVWRLYAALVDVEARTRQDPRDAMFAAERILRNPDARERDAIDPAALRLDVLGRDEAIVRYLCLDDRLLAWVITAAGVELIQQPLHAAELTYHTRRLIDAMERGAPDTQVRAALGFLHARLFEPLPPRVRGAKRLIVIADGPLARVPFAALWDSRRQRYLVEDHTVSRARSALDVIARRSGGPRSDGGPSRLQRALVIGNPAIDGRWWGGLPSLPSSEAEARTIGGLYRQADVLTGAAATPGRVRRAVAGRDVVHFGGHAVESSRQGEALLLLAPEAGGRPETGVLSMSVLLAAASTRPRVVVLAACRSGTGPRRYASGLTGLPEQLLSKGVESVVASLWDVEDESTQRLMTTLHRALVEGVPSEDALREAQLALMRSPDARSRGPAAWAGFIAVGGGVGRPVEGPRARMAGIAQGRGGR